MALCPSCGAPLPMTLDVREARQAAEHARAAQVPGLQRPEPLWVSGGGGEARAARGGAGLWIEDIAALVAAIAAWGWGRIERVGADREPAAMPAAP